MGITGNRGGFCEAAYARASRIGTFIAGIAYVAATAAIGRIGLRIDDDAAAIHLALPRDALVILANQAIRAGSAGRAVLQRVELYGLAAAIGRARSNHTFTVLTCRAVAAAVIALATVIEIGRCVMSGAIAYSISETFSVLA